MILSKSWSSKLYSDFKKDLSEIIIESLNPIKDKFNSIIKDKAYLLDVLNKGAETSRLKAYKTISKVYRKVGFIKNTIK